MQHSDLERLALIADDDGHWSWQDNFKAEWREVADNKQIFYKKWRSQPWKEPTKFPYSLAAGSGLNDWLPLDVSVGDEIVVTKAYEAMCSRILKLRWNLGGRGAVISGQPGIGKTTFLKYMLMRLISAHQTVVFYVGSSLTLFHAGQVYIRPAREFLFLPIHDVIENPVWALIDVDTETEGPPLSRSSHVWPIQASSPKPIHYDAWSKQYKAAKWGMPLWTFDEVVFGLTFQRQYMPFRKNLEAALNPTLNLPSSEDQAFEASLEILKREKDMKADPDSMDENEVMIDEDQGMLNPVDAAIEVLIRDAIREYGPAPRAIYEAIFEPSENMTDLQQAIDNLELEDLKAIVTNFTRNRALVSETSHRIISVSPIQYGWTHKLDGWEINFASDRIAKRVAIAMRKAEDQRLRAMYATFRSLAEGSTFAGCVFEALAHRRISGGSWPDGEPVISSMHSDENEPPNFSADGSISADSLSPLPRGPMTSELIEMPHSVNNFMADPKTYYIPSASNNPLFDSFTVDLNSTKSNALISVFQMTTSIRHAGSKKGYSLIRKIKGRFRELHPGVTIEVAYWLVCPSSDKHYTWKMPQGWGTTIDGENHRGRVFCLRIPFEVCFPH